ncbi:LLM class flavin-dependent oxidoreductase [Paenibacillus sp. Leaf72]|uniref:LLM class flavin-dependent oxidoreductase n=1 Tax=Paenibacillus sp. Leaf72 TaxID=1736234 RepID=UPI0006F33B5A|nr:LLM class flavin-dependent oxidoreductase [Paenibacillus sp. Leaf72]KQO18456.1 monooxygenase [Paenibacillus sp. Leaf72]
MNRTRRLALACSLSVGGNHSGLWRHPSYWSDASSNIDYFVSSAQKAEQGKLDFVFVGDTLFVNDLSAPQLINRLEPLTLLSVIAGATSHIGLVGTLSTTYHEPYHTARMFGSLDHISKGRAGWNVVTSALPGTAANFSRDSHMEHDQRYQLADEFLDVVKGLWDSWEEGAFVRDKDSGRYYDPSKLHTLNYKGKYFSVRGPLSLERTPQGRPVIVQAGSSEAGKDFAAKHAEIVFTHQHGIEDAKRFYQDIKERVARFGRNPEEVLVLPGISAIVADNEADLQRKHAEIDGLANIEEALKDLGKYFKDTALSRIPLDAPLLPHLDALITDGFQSEVLRIEKLIRAENLTLRELALRLAARSGRNPFAGTAEHVANTIQQWYEEEAADGFIVSSGPIVPEGIHEFVDLVVPLLQNRGLFRSEYSAGTLRGHLGLTVPPNRYSMVPIK